MTSTKTISIETINLRGYDVPTMAPKGGPVRCKMCGKPITVWGDNEDPARGIHTVLRNQPSAYVHAGCCWYEGIPGALRPYGSGEYDFEDKPFPPVRGKAAKDGLLFSFELESNNRMTAEQLVKWGAEHQIIGTEDCTVEQESHRITSASLCGMKEFLTGFSAEMDMTTDNCGAHIHVSFPAERFSADGKNQWLGMMKAIETLNKNKFDLFDGLRKDIETSEIAAKAIWGRSFGEWSENDMELVHGSWLNVNRLNTIEWRLPHFVTPAQYLWCVAMVKEFTLELIKFLDNKQNAEKTGKKMRKIYRKYAQGKGNAQRPERNDDKDLDAYCKTWEQVAEILPIKF